MAGAGYKLFTTGQVLTAAEVNTYLQEQVIMVFNDATARTTALSGVLAEGMVSYLKSTKVVEIYNGTAWASLDDPNAIQNTIVDAKGDLISASGNDVPARLAVGNDGESLVADSSTSTGLRYTAGNAVGNPVINSAFQVWQRGTSFAGTVANTNTYAADRWVIYRNLYTFSRQTTSDTTNLPNIQYCMRVQRDSGQTTTSTAYACNQFETVNSIPYAGRTVTLSFYARAGANFSAASSQIGVQLVSGTGTDQRVLDGFTGSANVINASPTLTTTWQRFSYTGTISTNATQLSPVFSVVGSGTAGANDWFEFTGVQLDVGSVALPFRTYSATLAGERSACERYYWRETGGNYYGAGYCTSTTIADSVVPFPTTMRVQPTLSSNSGSNYFAFTWSGGNNGVSAPTFYAAGTKAALVRITTTGLTTGQGGYAQGNNAAAYIEASAEL